MVDEVLGQGSGIGEFVDLFDPETFETTSALNGRKGVIIEAEFIRSNYGKQDTPEVTLGRVVVVSPDLAKPRVLLISSGDLYPSGVPGGRGARTTVGPFLTGGKIGKSTNIADFINALRGSGFPMQELSARGFAALVGAAFIWRAIEKIVNKKPKPYDVPGEYLGQEDIAQYVEKLKQVVAGPAAVALPSIPGPLQGQVSQTVSPEEHEKRQAELKATVSEAVTAALKEHNGNIPRSQLSIRVGPKLQGLTNKADAYALLINDGFLAGIPGVTFDKKAVYYSNPAVVTAADAPADAGVAVAAAEQAQG